MFVFACLIGIYSYIIFILGIFGWLYKDVVIGLTILLLGGVIVYKKNVITDLLQNFKKNLNFFQNDKNKNLFLVFSFLLLLQVLVNVIGALGPELGFDALWYHLTLPKLYLQQHSVFFIPGGLLYYSAMPKLAEMLYIAGFSFGNEIIVKCIHLTFGLLTCLVLYKLSRKFFTPLVSLIAVVIFYANLVVGWESISAYIDLIRTFFEVMALWAFSNWIKTNVKKWLVWSAIMLGFAITTKVLAIGSLIIFIVLSIMYQVVGIKKKNVLHIIRDTLYLLLISLAIPLPWFVFSFFHTGNPVYPFFSGIYPITASEVNIFTFIKEVWILLTQAADPVSPIYLMFLPLIVWILWKTRKINGKREMRVIGFYSLLAIIVWYFTPRTGGGRFILPYLPAFSILSAAIVNEVLENKKKYGSSLGKILLGLIIAVSLVSIGYRFAANYKYIPVILGQQTKAAFLSSHLNFAYGDFYDTDGYFKTHIKPTDKVLLFGFHNLYYVDFPFIDSSWRKPSETFTYVATQNTELPKEFSNWILVYVNEQTMVKLYKMPERLYSLR